MKKRVSGYDYVMNFDIKNVYCSYYNKRFEVKYELLVVDRKACCL